MSELTLEQVFALLGIAAGAMWICWEIVGRIQKWWRGE